MTSLLSRGLYSNDLTQRQFFQPGFAFILCISILHPPFPIFIWLNPGPPYFGWFKHVFSPHQTTIFHGWTENAMELHVLVRSVHQLGEDAMVTVAALKEQLPTTSGRWEAGGLANGRW